MARGAAICALLVGLVGAAQDDPSAGDVVQPKIVIPGEWLTDQAEKFLFLPLAVPTDLKLESCKVMSNGESILVVVTEQPQEEPETNALKKYKLLVEAIKSEVKGDESQLRVKLQAWYDTEDDDEVRVHVKSALDSLTAVRHAKSNLTPRTISVPLGMLAQQAANAFGFGPHATAASTSFLARTSTHNSSAPVETKEEDEAEHVLSSLHRATGTRVGIIKESFAVEVPYPVPTEHVFLLKTDATTLVVSMPLMRNSLEASGISTGGKPFNRVPVFSVSGKLLAGPGGVGLHAMARGLHVPSVAQKSNLKPLSL